MKIIDGKALAAKIREELKEKLAASEKQAGLAVVIVGDDSASKVYVRNKIKACGEVGILSYAYELPENAGQEKLEELLQSLADDERDKRDFIAAAVAEGVRYRGGC